MSLPCRLAVVGSWFSQKALSSSSGLRPGGVVDDAHRLGVAGEAGAGLLVGGVGRVAAHVAGGRGDDAVLPPEDPLHAPEAAHRDVEHLGPVGPRSLERGAEHDVGGVHGIRASVAATQGVLARGHLGLLAESEHHASVTSFVSSASYVPLTSETPAVCRRAGSPTNGSHRSGRLGRLAVHEHRRPRDPAHRPPRRQSSGRRGALERDPRGRATRALRRQGELLDPRGDPRLPPVGREAAGRARSVARR